MSKAKKKKVVTVSNAEEAESKTKSQTRTSATKVGALDSGLVFGPKNYKIFGISALLVFIGFVLMAGGGSESYQEFHPEEIYAWRRITLAPLVVLSGLGLAVYGIFKK